MHYNHAHWSATSRSDANHCEPTIWLLPSSLYAGWPLDLTLASVGMMLVTDGGCLQRGSCWLLAVLPAHSPQHYPALLFVFVSLWITCQPSGEIQDFHPATSSFLITCDAVSKQSSIWDAVTPSLLSHSCSYAKREITLLRAADLWTTAREMSVLSLLCTLAMLGSRFSVCFPENDGAGLLCHESQTGNVPSFFYIPLRKLHIIFAEVWSINAISQVSSVLLLL